MYIYMQNSGTLLHWDASSCTRHKRHIKSNRRLKTREGGGKITCGGLDYKNFTTSVKLFLSYSQGWEWLSFSPTPIYDTHYTVVDWVLV